MARFTSDNFNTGSIASGASVTFHRAIPSNKVNVGKIKIVPSGAMVGYLFEFFKKDTCLPGDRQYASKDPTNFNPFFDPTTRNGGELLEGFIIPYEDLDGTSELHGKITNRDAVARSYDVTIWYEDTAYSLAGSIKSVDLSDQFPGTSIVLPHTPSLFMGLWYEGALLYAGAGEDYTISGDDITLDVAGSAGEKLWAMYVV